MGIFSNNRQISYPKLIMVFGDFFISLFYKNKTQYLRKLIKLLKLNIKFEKIMTQFLRLPHLVGQVRSSRANLLLICITFKVIVC